MKRIPTLCVLVAAVMFAAPLFAASDYLLKIDGVQGESHSPGHEGWIELQSFSWGKQAGATAPTAVARGCANGQHYMRVKLVMRGAGPSKLSQMCNSRATIPSLTLEANGERHMLQNVMFEQPCESIAMGDGSVHEAYTLNFGQCLTHAGAGGGAGYKEQVAAKVQGVSLGDIKQSLNGVLIGLTPRPESIALQSLKFQGPNTAVIIINWRATPGVQGALQSAVASKQKLPAVQVQAQNMTWKFEEVIISSYNMGTGEATLNFAKADGPLSGFQDIHIK